MVWFHAQASLLLVCGLLFLTACTSEQTPEEEAETEWEYLFDGSSLDGWDTYLGPEWGEGITWATIAEQPARGLNVDTLGVFTIAEEDGQKVLRISGEYWGGISSKDEFENYHLQLQFKWGEKRWYPREEDKRDSGLLYHAGGEHGAGSGFWLQSQEFQIQEGDCGDYWAVATSVVDVTALLDADSNYVYDPRGELTAFGRDTPAGSHCLKFPDSEKTSGEWNTLDLYCYGGTSWHVVNGTLSMKLENSRQEIDGTSSPLTKGKIQLQSEAAEVFYRDIKIRPLEEEPVLEHASEGVVQ